MSRVAMHGSWTAAHATASRRQDQAKRVTQFRGRAGDVSGRHSEAADVNGRICRNRLQVFGSCDPFVRHVHTAACKLTIIALSLFCFIVWPASANMQAPGSATAGVLTTSDSQARSLQQVNAAATPRRRPLHRSISAGPEIFQRKESGPVLSRDGVMLLDLDKTTIFGNDGNDLGLALQWMDRPKESLDKLYHALISPLLRPAFEQMKLMTHSLDVVIYTRRPALLTYRSCFRRCMIPLRYKKLQREDGQLYVPGDIASPSDMFKYYCGPKLLPDEQNDVTKSLQRLLCARNAVAAAMGLENPPTVVVTGSVKNVRETVEALGLGVDRAFLFDDNRALGGQAGVVPVEPLMALPAEERAQLLAVMEEELPVRRMELGLVEFLLGAPAAERAIEWSAEDKTWRWRVPLAQAPLRPWPLPSLTAPASEHVARAAGAQRVYVGGNSRARSGRLRPQLRRQLSCL